LVRGWVARIAVLGASFAIMLGQALTGGRTGYLTWIMIGIVFAAIRWRKLLLIIPIVLSVVLTLVPAVRERMLQGIGQDDGTEMNEYEMTSGRNLAWPYVIDGIKEAPVLGHGRQAMATTGIRDRLWAELRESFPHPHNAYLETLLDNGIIGLVVVLLLFGNVIRASYRLVRGGTDPLETVAGSIAFSLVAALLVGSMGGQTFYPREGSVGMWAAVGVMFRVYVSYREKNEALGLDQTPELVEDTAQSATPFADYTHTPDANQNGGFGYSSTR
jgi:O-antigen ligase